jgi:hypothetical protein
VNLTPAQLASISQLRDHWSFLWDKRRSLWIAAEDCPDGEQIEEADLDVLLARLSGSIPAPAGPRSPRPDLPSRLLRQRDKREVGQAHDPAGSAQPDGQVVVGHLPGLLRLRMTGVAREPLLDIGHVTGLEVIPLVQAGR